MPYGGCEVIAVFLRVFSVQFPLKKKKATLPITNPKYENFFFFLKLPNIRLNRDIYLQVRRQILLLD